MRIAPLALAVLTTGLLSIAVAGSETPPEGPPWVRNLVEAQRAALERRVPIFVYLTKTH